jgi:hypothetical protein
MCVNGLFVWFASLRLVRPRPPEIKLQNVVTATLWITNFEDHQL